MPVPFKMLWAQSHYISPRCSSLAAPAANIGFESFIAENKDETTITAANEAARQNLKISKALDFNASSVLPDRDGKTGVAQRT